MDQPLGLGEMAKSPARLKMRKVMRSMRRTLIMTVVVLVGLRRLSWAKLNFNMTYNIFFKIFIRIK